MQRCLLDEPTCTTWCFELRQPSSLPTQSKSDSQDKKLVDERSMSSNVQLTEPSANPRTTLPAALKALTASGLRQTLKLVNPDSSSTPIEAPYAKPAPRMCFCAAKSQWGYDQSALPWWPTCKAIDVDLPKSTTRERSIHRQPTL